MLESLDIFVRLDCIYCTNLKIIIEKLKNKGLLVCPITYHTADITDSVPYIIKNKDTNPITLRGLPEKSKLYKFLQLDYADINTANTSTTTKARKIFKLS